VHTESITVHCATQSFARHPSAPPTPPKRHPQTNALVGPKLHLVPIGGRHERARHDPRIQDQDVQRLPALLECLSARLYGIEAGQVQGEDADPRRRGRLFDGVDGGGALCGVADGNHDLGALAGEHAGALEAEAWFALRCGGGGGLKGGVGACFWGCCCCCCASASRTTAGQCRLHRAIEGAGTSQLRRRPTCVCARDQDGLALAVPALRHLLGCGRCAEAAGAAPACKVAHHAREGRVRDPALGLERHVC